MQPAAGNIRGPVDGELDMERAVPAKSSRGALSSPWELILLALVVVIAVATIGHAFGERTYADAGLAYLGGLAARGIGRPETVSTWISTPFLGMVVAVLSVVMSESVFVNFVVALDVLCSVAVIAVAWAAMRGKVSAAWWWATLILACGFAPLASALWYKQPSIVAFAFAILGFALVTRRDDRMAGMSIALSIALKPVVILLPITLLLKRETRRAGLYTIGSGALLLAISQVFLAWRGHSLSLLSPLPAIQNFANKSDPNVNAWPCHPENYAPLSMSCRLVGPAHWGLQHILVLGLVAVLVVVAIDLVRDLPGTSWEWFALSCAFSPMLSPIAWAHYQIFMAPLFLLLAYQFRGRATFGLWLMLGTAFILTELIWQPLGTFVGLFGGATEPETSRFGLMTLSSFGQYILLAVALVWFAQLRGTRPGKRARG